MISIAGIVTGIAEYMAGQGMTVSEHLRYQGWYGNG